MDTGAFADLLAANARYATSAPHGFDGIAHAGVAIVTCMDSRLQPLEMVGLFLGEAKIMRTPGGHVTPDAVVGCVLGVHLLQVDRILVIQHTRCAMTGGDAAWMRARVAAATRADLGDLQVDPDPDQVGRVHRDVDLLRTHPLIAGRAAVGGFLYDVHDGTLTQLV